MAGYAFRMIEGKHLFTSAFRSPLLFDELFAPIDLGWARPNHSSEDQSEQLRTAELCTYWAAYTWDK